MIIGEESSLPNDFDVENDSSNSKIKLIPRITISENTGEVFSCKFSDDGQFLAAGCGDGAIRVFNSQTGVMSFNLQGGSNVSLPTTAMNFRPNSQTGAYSLTERLSPLPYVNKIYINLHVYDLLVERSFILCRAKS